MTELINLSVELDERFASDASARERVERAGYALEVGPDASDRVLAWIDACFGGAWSSEVAVACAAVATREGTPAGFAAFDARVDYAWLRGAAREHGVGLFGPFGVDPRERGGVLGPSLLQIALTQLRGRGYRRALIGAANEELVPYYAREAGAQVVERYDPRSFTPRPVRTVALASGSGTNLQAVIDAVAGGLPLELAALVTNKPEAFACERARGAGIGVMALPWQRASQTRAEYDAALRLAVAEYEPELVLLLGWMHLLDRAFLASFPQILNVHPAYLPLDPAREFVGMPDGCVIPVFRGAHAIRDAFAAGSPWTGASVHQVTIETDRGRVFTRKPLPIEAGEGEAALLARLHPIEHALLVSAIRRWLYER